MSKEKFTKELRQEIVETFATRHNGQFDPSLFLKEIEETGKKHPAHSWFQWDDTKAAREHRLWQARSFAKDLRVTFTIEQVSRQGEIKITTGEMPAVISPVEGRSDGGGYVLVDPNDPEHMAEHRRQAATALRSWLRRYQAAVTNAYGSPMVVEQIAELLENVKSLEKAAA